MRFAAYSALANARASNRLAPMSPDSCHDYRGPGHRLAIPRSQEIAAMRRLILESDRGMSLMSTPAAQTRAAATRGADFELQLRCRSWRRGCRGWS
jgi:hypothetical protein